MAESAAVRRKREAAEAEAAAAAEAEQLEAEHAQVLAEGADGEPGTEGAPEAPEAPSDEQGPADEPLRKYEALRSMGGVHVGGTFDALPSDPRVKSGYARLVPEAEVPAAVTEALEGG